MTQGWETKKLGDVCEINYGTRVVQKKDGGTIYPVYGGGGATFKMDRYNREDCIVVSRFAMSNQCVRYVRGKFFLNDSGLTVKTKEEKLSQEYLDKCIFSLNDKIYSLGKGVAQKNLDMKEFRHLDINYPCSKDEQFRIVEELDQLSNIIEKKRQQLSELDNLAQSIFYDMFGDPVKNEKGWEVKKLGDICKTSSGGTPSKSHSEYYEGGYIPWLRSGEVNKMYIFNTELFITEEGLVNSSAKWFPENTVVIAMYGATVGQVGILRNMMTTNQAICGIFPNESLIPIYLYHFLLSKKEEYIKLASGGAPPNISQNIIKDTLVCCPPLSLQQLFAQKIEAIEVEKEIIKQSISETENLYDCKMAFYFN